MNIKLRGLLLTAVLVGATASAFAGTGGLIGERYVAFDLGYSDYDDGGHLWTGAVKFNAPSTIHNLDLAFDVGYAGGGYSEVDFRGYQIGASATGYLPLNGGIKPYATIRAGWEQDRASAYGYSVTDSSFIVSGQIGVEVPVSAKGAIRVGFGYYDYTDFSDGDGLEATLGFNYWLTEKTALRAGYARDFEADSNTFTLGVAVRY